uniref:Putative secreted protein n=1 Tax=Anopheles darlingi TaxID=43151 RepID=A0A2M4D7B0_ANODA
MYLILLVAGERFAAVLAYVWPVFVVYPIVFNNFLRRNTTLFPTIRTKSRMMAKVDDERFPFPITFITQ